MLHAILPVEALPAEAAPVRQIHAGESTASPLRTALHAPDYLVAERRKKPKFKAGKIVLPTMEGLCFEKVKHIAYLEANGNYTVLHFIDGRQILVCRTLGDVESLLPSVAFIRIHRSHTVHLHHLKKYVRGKGGHVLLQNGVTLAVSAGQKDEFLLALKKYFG